MQKDVSGDQYAHIARSLSSAEGVEATLDSATATAVELVENCDHAGIAVVGKRHTIRTVSPTDDIASRGDHLQYDLGEGPCLQSIREEETVYSADLLTDARWPQWGPTVANDLGVRSALILQLFVGPSTIGSLNLYSKKPDAFSSDDRVSALALAAHIAIAMIAAQENEDLESAVVNRTVIGQAQGMLMQALKITPPQAFATLTRISQARNTKLHLVAADIIENGIRSELLS